MKENSCLFAVLLTCEGTQTSQKRSSDVVLVTSLVWAVHRAEHRQLLYVSIKSRCLFKVDITAMRGAPHTSSGRFTSHEYSGLPKSNIKDVNLLSN